MHTRGYVYLRAEGHPRSRGKGCYVAEHILVAEATLGRTLRHGEVVHHINGDTGDNRAENLRVMSAGEHKGLHAAELSITCPHTSLVNVRGRVYRCEACGMFVAAGHEDSPSIDQVKL